MFFVTNFFSHDEANHFIESALNETGELMALARSSVGSSSAGPRVHSNVRTSENAFVQDTEIAITVKARAFDLLRMPYFENRADGLQVLRYNLKQAYIPHNDWFNDEGENW